MVLSPLNAIIKQQVHALCDKGILACYLDVKSASGKTFLQSHEQSSDSDLENEKEAESTFLEIDGELHDIAGECYILVYCHPEQLLSMTNWKKSLHNHFSTGVLYSK